MNSNLIKTRYTKPSPTPQTSPSQEQLKKRSKLNRSENLNNKRDIVGYLEGLDWREMLACEKIDYEQRAPIIECSEALELEKIIEREMKESSL